MPAFGGQESAEYVQISRAYADFLGRFGSFVLPLLYALSEGLLVPGVVKGGLRLRNRHEMTVLF